MLEVDEVTKRYGSKLAVDAAAFTARPGRILGLLGPNGAGKTSILRMVNNITKPDAGEVRLDGKVVGRATQSATGYMPEDRGLYKNVKVLNQLVYLARLKGLAKAEARASAATWLDALEASDWAGKKPRELSRGMQQKVQFAMALVHSPRLVILDEPFSGLDPLNSVIMERLIRERRDAGATVIFASHRMEQVEGLCDEICLIANGRIVLSGELDAIKRRFGRNTVTLEFEGDGGFLARLAESGRIELLKNDGGRAELRVLDGFSAMAVLDAARAEAEAVHQYAATYPTLREIFIRVVGDASGAEEEGADLAAA